MSQVNVNVPHHGDQPIETVDSGDRTAAAGINLITVLIVLAVLAVIAWYLFTGPLRALGGGTTNVNVNTPAQPTTSVNVNVPNPGSNNSAPSGGSNTAPSGGSNTAPSGGSGNTGTRP